MVKSGVMSCRLRARVRRRSRHYRQSRSRQTWGGSVIRTVATKMRTSNAVARRHHVERHGRAQSAERGIGQLDACSMLFRDAACNRKTEAAAALLASGASVEAIEDTRAVRRRNSWPRILDA